MRPIYGNSKWHAFFLKSFFMHIDILCSWGFANEFNKYVTGIKWSQAGRDDYIHNWTNIESRWFEYIKI